MDTKEPFKISNVDEVTIERTKAVEKTCKDYILFLEELEGKFKAAIAKKNIDIEMNEKFIIDYNHLKESEYFNDCITQILEFEKTTTSKNIPNDIRENIIDKAEEIMGRIDCLNNKLVGKKIDFIISGKWRYVKDSDKIKNELERLFEMGGVVINSSWREGKENKKRELPSFTVEEDFGTALKNMPLVLRTQARKLVKKNSENIILIYINEEWIIKAMANKLKNKYQLEYKNFTPKRKQKWANEYSK